MRCEKLFSICILIAAFLFMLAGCTAQISHEGNNVPAVSAAPSDTSAKKPALTINEITKKYTDRKIVNTTCYGTQYVLVESKQEGEPSQFDFYNLSNGDRDVLPIGPYYGELSKIESEDRIIFHASGRNSYNGEKEFPFIIECNRSKSNPKSEEDFTATIRDMYLPVGTAAEVGDKENETLADLRLTVGGLEVLFEPTPGKEMEFYAAYTSIPRAKISYDKEHNQLIVEFLNTDLGGNISSDVKIAQENYFIKSVEVEKISEDQGTKVRLLINLKDTAKSYNAKVDRVGEKQLPFVRLSFSE